MSSALISSPEVDLERIRNGFSLISMKMRDADAGIVLWESNWDRKALVSGSELTASVPSSILEVQAVAREIVFTSEEAIHNFHVVQRVLFHGNCIEEWKFRFGFVIPGSTNSWETTIFADSGNMLPASLLSGNIVIETVFFDNDEIIWTTNVLVYYV